jgi:very-long-chain enoyl-CoA reductase
VFLVEYAGPIVITLLLILFQQQIYGQTAAYNLNQKMGIFMAIAHYVKRELETIFVHRFSNDTMPLLNIFKNSTHYWVFFGAFTMYFLLHPLYTSPAWISEEMSFALTALFCIFEFMNFQCHMVLKNLRRPGTTERGIPKGWGFGLVSSANYFWEALCWLTFALQCHVLGGYFFLGLSFFQMLDWALKKHNRYKKDFKDYPKGRKAMVPFII